MTNLSKFELNINDNNIKKTCCVSEAHQLDSSHPGTVLLVMLSPKEYKPYSK